MDKKNSPLLKGVAKTIFITFLVMIIIFLLLVYIIPTFLSIFLGKDLDSIDDNQMNFEVAELMDDNNMFFELQKINYSGVEEPKDLNLPKEFLNSDKLNDEVVLDLLEKNKEALTIFSIASEMEDYQNPYLVDSKKIDVNMKVASLNIIRAASRVSIVKSIWLSVNGNEDEAMLEMMKSIKIGNAMMNSQTSTIEYLVGMALVKNGLEGMQKIVSLTNDSDILNTYNERISEYEITSNKFYLITEYFFSKNTMEMIVEGGFGFLDSGINKRAVNNKFYFKKNQTISYYLDDYAKIIENAKKECFEKSDFEQQRNLVFGSLWDFPKLYFTENVIGKILFTAGNSALLNVEKKRCELEQKKNITEIAFAKRMYEIKNKKEPISIGDLLPHLINKELIDPLTGNEMSLDLIKGIKPQGKPWTH